MTRPSSLAVVAGAFGAMLLVAFFKGSILGVLIGALLSPLPLAMAALGLGVVYLPVAVVGGAVTVMVLTGSFLLATVYLLVDAAPVAVLTRLVGRGTPEGGSGGTSEGAVIGRMVSFMTVGVAVVIIAGLLAMPAGSDGIEAALRARLDELVAATPAAAAGLDLTAARTAFVHSLAGLLPGAAAWNWSLRALISAVLAQFMLKRMNLALWTTPPYSRFQVPAWFFLLLAGTAGLAVILKGDPGFIAGNAAVALCLPPVLQGLALVHCGFGRLRQGKLALGLFYAAALALPSEFLVLLVAAGVMEHFFQWRVRYFGAAAGGV